MAIDPINLSSFSRNPVGIEAVIARGSSALSQILQNASQTGRDQANNQARAERDFLAEQRREINLAQRRGELVQQDLKDQRNYDEGVRRFDATFGEGARQYDTRVEQANLDRIRTDRSLDMNKAKMRQDAKTEARRLNISEEDLKLKQEERAANREIDRTRLDNARLQLQSAKTEADRAAAKTEYDKSLRDTQAIVLANMDTLIETGDPDVAKSFFRTHVENPAYEFPDSTRSRLARQLGIDKERGSASSGSADTPIDEMSLEEVDREITIFESATGDSGLTEKAPTEDTAIRMADLKRRKRELELGTKGGRTSEADRLRTLGRQNR